MMDLHAGTLRTVASRRPILALAVGGLLLGMCDSLVWADGGTVRAVERHGSYQVSVFTAPNPLRAGPVDLSVLVQDVASGQPVSEESIVVTLTPVGRPRGVIRTIATSEAATNKLLRSAMFELPDAGKWNVEVTSTVGGVDAVTRFDMEAGERLPRWSSEWVWYCWPAVAAAAFGAHRWLAARRKGRDGSPPHPARGASHPLPRGARIRLPGSPSIQCVCTDAGATNRIGGQR